LQLKADNIGRLVVLPLYPQFSISTSGSSLRLLEALFKADPQLAAMPHTVIPSWYQRPGYITAMADLIEVPTLCCALTICMFALLEVYCRVVISLSR
jgi:protoheme ferro-lyase